MVTTIIHDFEGLNVSKDNGAASLTLKVNSTLKKLGFGRASFGNLTITNDSIDDDLNIYFLPNMNGFNYINRSFGRSEFVSLKNYLKELNGNCYLGDYYSLRDDNFINQISLKIKYDDKNVEIGHYLPDRNIVILYLPILVDWNLGLENKYVLQVLKYVEEVVKNYNIKKVNTEDIKKKIILEKFVKRINDNINNINSNIMHTENYIKSYNEKVVDLHGKRVEYTIDKISKEQFKQQVISGMDEKLRDIKKLKFVESVKLGDDGIIIKFPTVYIKVKDVDILMGSYTITIKPEKVMIINDKPITREGSIYHSPHISGNNVCFGQQNDNVSKLLGEFDFKKLTHFLWMYLNSYNQGDTYIPMNDWINGRNNNDVVPREHTCSYCKSRVMDCDWNEDMGMCNNCGENHFYCEHCSHFVHSDNWNEDKERCNNCVEALDNGV